MAASTHVCGSGAGTGESAAQVHIDDGVEVLVGHFPQNAVTQDSCVGDQYVQTTEVVQGGRGECIGRGGRADGGPVGNGHAGVFDDLGGGRLGGVAVGVVDHDGGSAAGQFEGVGTAEAAACSGDHG